MVDPARWTGGLGSLPDPLELGPPASAPDVVVRPPGSKSLTNRALLLAALASGESVLRGALTDADDARRMLTALGRLGVGVSEGERAGEVRVEGVGGRLRGGAEVNLNNAGTATRFLTAAACLADGPVVIDGNARMRQRPIGEQVALLRALGVEVEELGEPGCVPLRVHPARLRGGSVDVPRTRSSQYVSAVMMVAPFAREGVTLRFPEGMTSPSYVRMTARLMARVGVGVEMGSDEVRVGPGGVRGFELDVEPDASGATYFWGAGAVVPGARVGVAGDWRDPLQGDAAFPDLLARMGAGVERGSSAVTVMGADALEGIDADCEEVPDAAMTLAVVCCFARGESVLRGLRTLRDKETDRLEALRAELTKLGVGVEIRSEGSDESLVIRPPSGGVAGAFDPAVEIETYDDHRMAMAPALAGLRCAGVLIRDPSCVAKTYATFWRDWARLYGVGAG